MSSNALNNFFLVMAAAFILFTVWEAYDRGNRRDVTTALSRRNWQTARVLRLRRKLSGLHTAYEQSYVTLRNKALATLSQARGLCELYRTVVQHHSIDEFDPEIPDFRLPPELESEQPPQPPVPKLPDTSPHDKEKRQ